MPELQRKTTFSSFMVRDSDQPTVVNCRSMLRNAGQPTVAELEQQSGVPYLSGPLDFKVADLPGLLDLETMVRKHLARNYKVSEVEDLAELYFHTHYSISTHTAHLHVRVNQLRHPLELDKSIKLADCIRTLEQGQDTTSISLSRGVIHKELKSLDFLSGLGYPTRVIPNPYLLA
eukprot:g11650.t1